MLLCTWWEPWVSPAGRAGGRPSLAATWSSLAPGRDGFLSLQIKGFHSQRLRRLDRGAKVWGNSRSVTKCQLVLLAWEQG